MSQKNLLLIVNPCSGKGKMKTALFSVVDIFSKADYDVTVYTTRARSDATEKVKTIKNGEYDLMVVCGGDGTLNEVISGLMQTNNNCPIGYIPAGTLNEWSGGLGISRSIKKAATDIVNGREITLDIGRFSDNFFTYTASFGAFTDVSYSTSQKFKTVLGQAAYFLAGIKSVANIKAIELKLECDERKIEGKFLFGAISNSLSVGGIVKFDKSTVTLNDGLFEVLLIRKPKNLLKLKSVADGILKHDLNREGMEFFHTKSIKILNGEGLDWTLDGEHAVSHDITEIENIHNAVRFIIPRADEKKKKNKKDVQNIITKENNQ